MANIRMEGESGNAPQAPSRISGRNRKKTPLVASFKQQLNSTPQSEIDDLSKQLNIALAGLSSGPSAPPSSINVSGIPASPNMVGLAPKMGGMAPNMGGMTRMKSTQKSQAASSAGRMLLGRPNFPTPEKPSDDEDKPKISSGHASTGDLLRRQSSKARREKSATIAASMTARIPDWDGYYKPVSSSRRNSRAGSELSISMKKSAQAILEELGEVSDDEDDDDFLAMPQLKEESLVGDSLSSYE